MKIEELISKLIEHQKKHPGIQVLPFDCRMNLNQADGDPCGAGIYSEYKIEILKGSKPKFLAISFENEDYLQDGGIDEGSSIFSQIKKSYKK